jgi:SEC-C motif-containing protein
LIRGEVHATTAEDLMRSRYAAYTVADLGYLLGTHDPVTVNSVDPKIMATWAKKARFDGLEILGTEGGGVEDDEGIVEFVAKYTQDGASYRHHERSRFRKTGGRWYYVQGTMIAPTVKNEKKVGRNDPCPCGSGKKFKKCCG